MPPTRTVIDVDSGGQVRGRFERCRCYTWPGPAAWVDEALRADRAGGVVHHPSCDARTLGAPFDKEWRDGVAKKLKPLADSVAVFAAALRAAVPIIIGGYVAYQLLGPATTYAAARAGARSGSRRRKRARPRRLR